MSRHAQIALATGILSGFLYLALAFEAANRGELDSGLIWGLAGGSLFLAGLLSLRSNGRRKCPGKPDALPPQ